MEIQLNKLEQEDESSKVLYLLQLSLVFICTAATEAFVQVHTRWSLHTFDPDLMFDSFQHS